MERKTYTRICILVLTLVLTMLSVNAAWWDSNYGYRQNVTITANVNTQTNYQVLLQLNSSNLGANFDWSNNCADIRFIHSGSELDYWVETCNVGGQELYVWVEMNQAVNAGNTYDILMYYNNGAASSASSAANTFRQNEIFQQIGDCTNTGYCNGMDNNNEVDYIKSQIGTAPFGIHGQGYVTQIYGTANPYGASQYYYNRYRFLFIPSTSGSYEFGTDSDDGSEGIFMPYDSYGDGYATSYAHGTETVIAYWYGLHGAGNCYSGTETTQSLTAGNGYWIDYMMNEWGGSDRARLCMGSSGLQTVDVTTFPNQIYAREYALQDPSVTNIGVEETFTYMQVIVDNPNPVAVQYVLQNREFDFSVTINCIGPAGESCGIITNDARQNSSGAFTNIATTSNTPLWTSSSQGQTCSLTAGNSCSLNYKINATGTIGNYYYINLFADSNQVGVEDVVSKNVTIRIIDTNIVSFNQTSYTFENFTKLSGDKTAILKVESNIGDNNNIQVNCQSGDCSIISDNWIDGTNLLEGNSQDILFTCDDAVSGTYSAIFNVTSNGNPYSSQVEINCEVMPIFGPMNVQLNLPIVGTTITVGQNDTFNINGSVNCVGICGEISAYAIFTKPDWWDFSWSYRRNVTITTTQNTGTNYQVLLRLDNTDLGSNFDWSNNCNDVRFVHEGNLIDYWIENCDTALEELDVWIETDEAILTTDEYEIDIYYGNNAATSLSNASETFRNDEIYEIAGRCPTSNANCDMSNHGETNVIRSSIGTGVFTVDGSGYNTEINMANNPYGTNDAFYMRFRWLFIPDTTGTYRFGTYSDDSSEITIFPFDGYGGGIRTDIGLGSHDVMTYMYDTWHNNNPCGSTTVVTIGARTFNAGEGYWMDYMMQEGGGGEDAMACTSIDSATVADYDLFSTTNFPGQIFARNYVTPEPTVGSISSEEGLAISTNLGDTPLYTFNSQPQTCIPVEDGSCSFNWLVNATGPVYTSYDVSVIFISNLSQISSNQTLTAQVNITDNIIPTVTLISPINNEKILVNENISLIWQVSDDSMALDCNLYINGVFNQTKVCSNSGNNSINLSLTSGHYNWTIEANDIDLNLANSSTWNFYYIQNISKTIEKSVKYENINQYKIEIIIKDLTSKGIFGTLIEWMLNGLNSGSRSPVEDWLESTSNGEYIGWDEKEAINHSIAGAPGYKVRNTYVIGLE